MAKKKKKDAGGVPEWVVTFGDMMSLLLCFFILLQMFSELKQEKEYQRVVTAIKEAFGYQGGIGVLPVDNPPLKSMVEVMEQMSLKRDRLKTEQSNSDDPGVNGPEIRVKKIQDGIVYTIGGPSTFDSGSAAIKPQVRAQLERLSIMLAGRRNTIRIVGHASAKYLPADSEFRDLDDLSYERARAVRDALIEFGLNEQLFELVAAGTRRPMKPRAAGQAESAENRRVEVILTENVVEDFNPDVTASDPANARGPA